MAVQQIAVFMENSPGRIAEITALLCDNKIDIRAINTADTTEFGILRMIVDNPSHAERVLRQRGMSVSITEVLAIMIEDEIGSLSKIMNMLKTSSVNVDYMYSFIGEGAKAVIVLKTDNNAECARVLTEKGIKILSAEELRSEENAKQLG